MSRPPFEVGAYPPRPGEEDAGVFSRVPPGLTVSPSRSRFTPGSQSLTSTPAEHQSPKDVRWRRQLPILTSTWKATARSSAREWRSTREPEGEGEGGEKSWSSTVFTPHSSIPFSSSLSTAVIACVCFQVQQFQWTEDLDSPPCHCFHSQILLLFNLIFYVGELYFVLFWSCYWRLTEMTVSRGNSPDSFFSWTSCQRGCRERKERMSWILELTVYLLECSCPVTSHAVLITLHN